MKEGIRVIGITSGPIGNKDAVVFGIIIRSGVIEGALSTRVAVNGCDGTKKILRMIAGSRFKTQIKAIALNGIAIAGLNVVDVNELEKKLNVNVFIVTRKKPKVMKLVGAVKKFSTSNGLDRNSQIKIIKEFAKNTPRRFGSFYIQGRVAGGMENISAMLFDAVRASHIVARALATGESKGRI